MITNNTIVIGKSHEVQKLFLNRANRHGLIAGATGTGKTVTLQILAEGFSQAGVPVFAPDIKGDLSGISQAIEEKAKLVERAAKTGVEGYTPRGFPTVFWDIFGKQGHPVRTTISEMGPLLLSRLLDLNDTQEGVLNIAFKLADDEGLLLLDFKDLRAILNHVGENSKTLTIDYGNVSKQSIGAIQRRLLVLEQQGAKNFFGEPALKLSDLMRTNEEGKGYINLFAADELMQNPRLYSTFLLWLLSELFEELPEVGDPEKPKVVFFFDEAHLLFNDAPKALTQKVEQVVRLIRSKGVGVYFVTQNPIDVPDEVLGQLGNRIQHALRAYTPRDKKAVQAAATTFRENPDLDTETVITELGVGEALVSVLDPEGIPTIVQQTKIRPPESRMGPATKPERRAVFELSPIKDVYDTKVDRESASEKLKARTEEAARKAEKQVDEEREYQANKTKKTARKRRSSRETTTQTVVKSATKMVTSRLGQSIIRGIMGSIFKGR
ncbi:MAG: helicase HerA-like domain-containing protein [Gammaproteobacteria bacterium]